jgi:hypothetical protein
MWPLGKAARKRLSKPARGVIDSVRYADNRPFDLTPDIARELCEDYFGKYWRAVFGDATGLPYDTDWDALSKMTDVIPRVSQGEM